MKRTTPALMATGLLGALLAGTSPASASTIDCEAGDYTRARRSYVPTNVERFGVDGHTYNIGGPYPYNYEICLDVPDGTTFTIEVRSLTGDQQTFFVDDRPGDKIFHYSLPPDSVWGVYGTLTGPPSTLLYYTWHEKQLPT